ncbi:hypothetical protein [Nannocystis pusilla]|uniref:hypothetical protein n=1 Tax=Nannocystis pusilla TaxID=889268 RepID=UPI003BEFCEE7
MLRKILLLCPALAFALPLLAASPSEARPLAIPAHPAEWCWGGNNDCDFGEDLLLAVCVQTQIFVQTGQDDRAYDCDTLSGPSCLASCDDVAGDDAGTCRSQCDGEGAMFCAPAQKTRWGGGGWGPWGQGIGPWGPGIGPGWGQGWDDDRPDFDDDQALFVDTQTCLQLDLNDQ